MKRTLLRGLAVQLCFAEVSGTDLTPDEFFAEDYFCELPSDEGLFSETPSAEELSYIRTIVNGVSEHRVELDAIIEKYSRGWKLSRISRTALAVLRCALYEIKYMPNVPASVSINEAVELAKGYDEPDTVRFINGILGSYVREDCSPSVPAGE